MLAAARDEKWRPTIRPGAAARMSRSSRAVLATTATTAGGPATPSVARDTAPLPDGVKAVDDGGFKGGGGDDDGRRASVAIGRVQHGASPGGGEGRPGRWPQGRRRRWQEGMQRRCPSAPQRLARRG